MSIKKFNKKQELEIVKLYENTSAPKIAKKLGVSVYPIYRILKSHDKIRPPSKTNKLIQPKLGNWDNQKTLYYLYVNQQLSISDIAIKFKTNKAKVRRRLQHYDIPIRTSKKAMNLNNHKTKISQIIKTTWTKERRKEYSRRGRITKKLIWSRLSYRKSMERIMQSKEYRNMMQTETLTRHKNPEYTAKLKPLISAGLKDKWTDEQYRKLMSKAAKKIFQIVRDNPILIEKMRTNHAKAMQDPEYRQARSKLAKELWTRQDYRERLTQASIDRWKSDEYRKKFAVARVNISKISSQQLALYDILSSLNITFEQEYPIGHYNFDCFLPDHKILIEVQGDYWHSLPKAIRNDKSKATYIEKYFPQYKLKYLWEHEFKCRDKIIELVKYWTGTNIQHKSFNFDDIILRDCETKEVNDFLQRYHYLHKHGNSKYKIGFYLQDILIGLITFGQITRRESADRLKLKPNELLELTRLCIHPQYQVKNLASWMISKAVKVIKSKQKYKKIISFADNTFNHEGTVYKASNFKLDGEVNPSYWYVDRDGYVMHKRTMWTHATNMKMSESEFAKDNGYTKVWGFKKNRFVLDL